MADKRVTARLNEASLRDLDVIVAATELPAADVMRLAMKRLADGYRFLAATGRDVSDARSENGALLLMPLLERRRSEGVAANVTTDGSQRQPGA